MCLLVNLCSYILINLNMNANDIVDLSLDNSEDEEELVVAEVAPHPLTYQLAIEGQPSPKPSPRFHTSTNGKKWTSNPAAGKLM